MQDSGIVLQRLAPRLSQDAIAYGAGDTGGSVAQPRREQAADSASDGEDCSAQVGHLVRTSGAPAPADRGDSAVRVLPPGRANG